MITLLELPRTLAYYDDGTVTQPPGTGGGGTGGGSTPNPPPVPPPNPPSANYPAFPTSIRAIRGAQRNTSYRNRSVQFGSGYWDASPDGLNPETFTLSPTFRGLTLARRNQLNSFIRNVGGHTPFYFLVDGNEFELFSLISISETSMGGDYWEISLELQNRHRADG